MAKMSYILFLLSSIAGYDRLGWTNQYKITLVITEAHQTIFTKNQNEYMKWIFISSQVFLMEADH